MENNQLVGMSLGDLATQAKYDVELARTLGEISVPSSRAGRQAGVLRRLYLISSFQGFTQRHRRYIPDPRRPAGPGQPGQFDVEGLKEFHQVQGGGFLHIRVVRQMISRNRLFNPGEEFLDPQFSGPIPSNGERAPCNTW